VGVSVRLVLMWDERSLGGEETEVFMNQADMRPAAAKRKEIA
jgi:hypothetical protein